MFEYDKIAVGDNEENRAICRKYCRNCENYRKHSLEQYLPIELCCVRGQSSRTGMRMIGCFCSGCELYSKHHLRGGYF